MSDFEDDLSFDDGGFEEGSIASEADPGIVEHDMKLFHVNFKWMDGDGITDRVTQSVLLPSGVKYLDDDVVQGQVLEGQMETKLSVDMSHLVMLNPQAYSDDFKATVDRSFEPQQNRNSNKMAADRKSVV